MEHTSIPLRGLVVPQGKEPTEVSSPPTLFQIHGHNPPPNVTYQLISSMSLNIAKVK